MNCIVSPIRSIRRALPVKYSLGLLLLVTWFASAPTLAGDDEVRQLIKQAQKLVRAESLPEAETLLRRAVSLDANRSDAKVELGFVLTKRRKLIEAFELLVPIVRAEQKNARAFAVLGSVLLAAGRFKDAGPLFLTAIKLDRREDLGWAGFGMLNFYENRIDDSLNYLQEAIFHEPGEPDYWFAFAQISARAERYNEAANAYNRFLSVSRATDVDRRARIKGLIDFLHFVGQREGLYSNSGKDQTSIKFELVGNRPIIAVRVNGSPAPLRFVIDTGSGITVISDETAKRLRIKPITRGGYAKGLGGDGRFEIVYGFLNQIQIGDVSVRNIPVYIRKFQGDQQPVDGYIGLSVISKFLATVDYGNSTFALQKRDADRKDAGVDAALSLPLRLTSSGFLSGEVLLEGIEAPLNFIVDTGASISVISEHVARTDTILPFANEERLRVIGSAGVTDDVPTFLLPKVSFGPHSRKKIVAIALDLDIINEASGFEQAGILGGNFLKNYRLTFDFRNSKVLFTSIRTEN